MRCWVPLFVALAAVCVQKTAGAVIVADRRERQCDADMRAHYPAQQVVYETSTPPVIDGAVNGDPVWDAVGWSTDFVDIATTTVPEFRTRVKLRYDAEYLYVAAHLVDRAVWANITYSCHCINASEDQVIFHDNDFELFVDTLGTTHWYKEFEINAANANWNILLDRPYADGGTENSSRVDGANGFDFMHRVPPARTAVKVLDGTLNDPASRPTGWTVELALPLKTLAFKTQAKVPPGPGQYWRANFARVEWGVRVPPGTNRYEKAPSCQSCADPGAPVSDNWVWTPMMAVDLHVPELWGYLQFSNVTAENINRTALVRDPQWPQRWAAHNLFEAQRAIARDSSAGVYSDDIQTITRRAAFPDSIAGGCVGDVVVRLGDGGRRYTALIYPAGASGGAGGSSGSGSGSGVVVTVNEMRLTLAMPLDDAVV